MKLSSTWCAGMLCWVRWDISTWFEGTIESVGITKLTILSRNTLQKWGPSFVVPRNPKLRGSDNPMLVAIRERELKTFEKGGT